MGNQNQAGRAGSELGGPGTLKGTPVLFHQIHSENISLSVDRRRARRVESFCKGICFSHRPVQANERVYIKFADVSTSWSGVIRFGFTANDPANLNPADLPRYACPDLTNKPGYWAKAMPERCSELGNVLFFYFTRNGDVMYGVNGEEKGIFFGGVGTNVTLWALVDIYGNTTAMEFVDGRQLNNLAPAAPTTPGATAAASPNPTNNSTTGVLTHTVNPSTEHNDLLTQQIHAINLATAAHAAAQKPSSIRSPAPPIPSGSTPSTPTSAAGAAAGDSPSVQQNPVQGFSGIPPVRHHAHCNLKPLPFHAAVHGRNVCLSADRSTASRLVEEYCNGYVFTPRPLLPGETLVLQILATDQTFCGGLAFGMTSCDPATVRQDELPDDSDLLLDRAEYWVVNKDVCAKPEVADELTFTLTIEGEVRYGRNGHHISTLMHVDKTLPMWAFLDVYSSTQKIKCLGVMTQLSSGRSPLPGRVTSSSPGLTVALPPPRNQPSPTSASSRRSSTGGGETLSPPPPPRPPPPRPQSGSGALSLGAITPPSLPPKQYRERGGQGQGSVMGGMMSQSMNSAMSPTGIPLSLPPPLIPQQVNATSVSSSQQQQQQHLLLLQHQMSTSLTTSSQSPSSLTPPPPPPRTAASAAGVNTTTMTTNPFSPHFSHPAPTLPMTAMTFTTTTPDTSLSLSLSQSDSADALTIRRPETDSQEAADNASNECTVCWEKPPNCVIYTCGHMCMCFECAVDIKNNQGALCPICRQEIKDIIKIFKS